MIFNRFMPTPCFAPDETGQGGGDPVAEPEDGQVLETTPEPFYTDPHSGTPYGTREELDQAMKDSFMMQGTFTKKMQALSQDRENFEMQRKDFNRAYDELNEREKSLSTEYKQFERLMKERPDVYKAMKAQLGQAPGAGTQEEIVQRIIDEKYGDKLQRLDAWEKQQEQEKELSGIYDELTEQYPDLDREAIEEALGNLDGMKSLVETIYHGLKGRGANPLDTERKITEKLEKKQKAGLAPASTAQPTATVETGSLEEIGDRLRSNL